MSIILFTLILIILSPVYGIEGNRSAAGDKTTFPFERVLEQGEREAIRNGGASVEFRNFMKERVIEGDLAWSNTRWSYFKQFLKLFRLQWFTANVKGPWAVAFTEDKAGIAFIFNIINVVIALSSFVAVWFLIYWFYGIFFASDDDGYATAKTITKNTAIALFIIWLSFFVTTMVLYMYNTIVK